MCIVVASSSIQEELDLTKLRHRNNRIKTDLMDKKYNVEEIYKKGSHALWDLLIDEAEALQKETEKPIHVMDVGMWKPQDCLRAANHGLDAHCIEPSPLSNKRIMEGFHEATEEDRKHIRFYKMAAAATTGKLLLFQSGGTQSDHIGDFTDTWKMSRIEHKHHGSAWLAETVEPFHVKTVAIDDIIDNKVKPNIDYSGEGPNIDKLFLVKVDTQGYEPEVMKGMKESIKEQKIDYLIVEYWPKGIAFIFNATEADRCEKPAGILQSLWESGYSLYAMPILSHSDAPKEGKEYLKSNRGRMINYKNFTEHCKFFYEVEEKNPSEDYKMGYWSDILAVSPHASLPSKPMTELGTLVQSNL